MVLSLLFSFLNLTRVIMAVKITQLEKRRPRLKTSSQIPQNSKLGFLFPPPADFPSWAVSFSLWAGQIKFGHLPSIFLLLGALFSFLLLWSLCPFLPHHCCSSSHAHSRSLMLCSCSSERKQSLNPNAIISGGPCRKQINHRRSTQHSVAERLPSEGNTSQMLRESRFWWVVFHPPSVRRIGLSNQSCYFFFSVWFRRLYIRGKHL